MKVRQYQLLGYGVMLVRKCEGEDEGHASRGGNGKRRDSWDMKQEALTALHRLPMERLREKLQKGSQIFNVGI